MGRGAGVFTPENAAAYGEWLGIGIASGRSSGSSAATDPSRRTRTERSSSDGPGIREGDGGAHLLTFHPTGRQAPPSTSTTTTGSTSTCARTATCSSSPSATQDTRADYARKPVKPIIDGEPIYEDHPVSFKPQETGHSVSCRRPAAALLEPLLRSVRPHLRPPLGLADVAARPQPVNFP